MLDADGVLRIPYAPRQQFLSFHKRAQRFAILVCHRRAGKTIACVNDLIRACLSTSRDGFKVAYIGPTYAQTKSVAWEYVLRSCGPMLQYGAKANQSELRVDFPNGSQIRLFGADNYDALRGLRLDGVVLDEFADFDPRAWTEVIRPALSDRRGFAVFIGTPKGHNAFYEIWSKAQNNPDWFTLMLKASESVPINDRVVGGRGIDWAADNGYLVSEELKDLRSGMPDEEYAQEFECSFEAAVKGAVYGRHMAAAEVNGRIRSLSFDPSSPVYTAWDIGGDHDSTAIWFCQLAHNELHIIDHYEAVGADSAPHAKHVLEKPYIYATHWLPHDAGPKKIGINKSYKDFLEDHGLKNIIVLPNEPVEVGINTARLTLPRCYFDAIRCKDGIECLKMYHFEFDEKSRTMRAKPKHDWASHSADAFRYLCVGMASHRAVSSSFRRKILYPKSSYA